MRFLLLLFTAIVAVFSGPGPDHSRHDHRHHHRASLRY